jgi:hypothetical protein
MAEKKTKTSTRKKKIAEKDEKPIIKEPSKLIHTKVYEVSGLGLNGLLEGKIYKVSGIVAESLIEKGLVKLV